MEDNFRITHLIYSFQLAHGKYVTPVSRGYHYLKIVTLKKHLGPHQASTGHSEKRAPGIKLANKLSISL